MPQTDQIANTVSVEDILDVTLFEYAIDPKCALFIGTFEKNNIYWIILMIRVSIYSW